MLFTTTYCLNTGRRSLVNTGQFSFTFLLVPVHQYCMSKSKFSLIQVNRRTGLKLMRTQDDSRLFQDLRTGQ